MDETWAITRFGRTKKYIEQGLETVSSLKASITTVLHVFREVDLV